MPEHAAVDRRAVQRRAQDKRAGPMGADDSEVLSVRLPKVLDAAVEALADQDGLKVSELVRALLIREVQQRLRRSPVNISRFREFLLVG